MSDDIPKAPTGTGPAGLELWARIQGQYELSPWETALLIHAVKVEDRISALDAHVDRVGEMVPDPKRGLDIPNPAGVEARQLRIVQSRLMAAMRLPDPDTGQRPQRRATRGVYRPRVIGGGGGGSVA